MPVDRLLGKFVSQGLEERHTGAVSLVRGGLLPESILEIADP
jgi:hypothetical protein